MIIIEFFITKYLSEKLDVKVYAERPQKPQASYLIIDKTGGNERNHISEAMIAIQSIAETKAKAAILNEKVKTAMREILIHGEISKCELNADYDFSDLSTKEYR